MDEGFVYFIKAGTEFVKIGYSKEVKQRLNTIKSSNPQKVSLLGVIEGGVKKEREIQSQFRHFRIRGEWFDLSLELKKFIDDHAVNYSPPKRKGQHTKEREPAYQRIPITVYLTVDNAKYLKLLSEKTGISMSAIVNMAIEEYAKDERERQKTESYYFIESELTI